MGGVPSLPSKLEPHDAVTQLKDQVPEFVQVLGEENLRAPVNAGHVAALSSILHCASIYVPVEMRDLSNLDFEAEMTATQCGCWVKDGSLEMALSTHVDHLHLLGPPGSENVNVNVAMTPLPGSRNFSPLPSVMTCVSPEDRIKLKTHLRAKVEQLEMDRTRTLLQRCEFLRLQKLVTSDLSKE